MKSFYDRLTITIHLFYLVIAYSFFERFFKTFFDHDLFVPTKFVWVLRWLPEEWFTTFIRSVCITGVLSVTVCVVFPWNRFFRLISFLSIFFFIAIAGSYIRITHDVYGCLFSAFALIFLPRLPYSRDSLQVSPEKIHKASQILFMAQFMAISCYALAGLWKLRYLAAMFSEHGLIDISKIMGNTIAYEHLIYSHDLNAAGLFLINHDDIATLFFLGLVLLQLTSCVLIFLTRWHFYLGLMLFLFHALSEIILNIPFRPQMYLVLALIVCSPFSEFKFWQKKSLPKEAFDIE